MDSMPIDYSDYHLGMNESLQQSFPALQTSHASTLADPNYLCNPTSHRQWSKSVDIPSSTMDSGNPNHNSKDSISLDGIPSEILDNRNVRHNSTNDEVAQPENAANSLIHREDPHNVIDVLEKVHINSEVDSRLYHNTMRQGASKGSKSKAPAGKSNMNPAAPPFKPQAEKSVIPKPADPTEQFTEAMSKKIRLLLTSMRIWQGEVQFEAQFGRVILRSLANNVVAWGDSQLSHTIQDMDWVLGWHSKTMGFTEILTTLGADAQWVVDLKNASNEPMWKNAPKRSVKYEFECYDEKSSTSFMVEIDAGTSETKVKSLPKEIGAVWVHCTMRNWDYRLTATGSKNLEKEHGHIASEIAKNIFIE